MQHRQGLSGLRTWRLTLLLACLATPALTTADMVPLTEQALAAEAGQGLLVADQIVASSIAGTVSGTNGNGIAAHPEDNNLTFYRMGLDSQLGFNANINRLQLGCGGINDYLATGCDIDLSYVSFMGNNGLSGTSSGPGNAVTSDFNMTRPYVEVAVTNDGNANREVVGINIGSQSADGYLGIGRQYNNGQFNQETNANCNVGSTSSTNCDSGLNRFSGNMGVTLFGYVSGNVTCFGVPCAAYNANLTGSSGNGTDVTPVYGSRIATAQLTTINNVQTHVSPYCCLPPFTLNLQVNLKEPLYYIHGLSFNGVPDFDISFQRQKVAYPTYDKTAFNATANTGWWMNAPSNVSVNVADPNGPSVDASAAFGTANLANVSLGVRPPQNCFGTAQFC